MRHSITFGDKNTWSDWGIIPMKQPVFAMPKVKTKIIDLPAGNGVIDLSEAVSGYPVYANRQGSFSFLTPARYTEWLPLFNRITQYLHGQYMQAILEDEPNWYYEGRFSVNQMACDEQHGTIVIDYDVGPYKWENVTMAEPWEWNPFSFVDGVIGNGTYVDTSTSPPTVWQGSGLYAGIELSTTAKQLAFTPEATGSAPQQIGFAISNGENDSDGRIILRDGSLSVTLPKGETTVIPGLVLYRGGWIYEGVPTTAAASTTSGTTYLTMDFRRGML